MHSINSFIPFPFSFNFRSNEDLFSEKEIEERGQQKAKDYQKKFYAQIKKEDFWGATQTASKVFELVGDASLYNELFDLYLSKGDIKNAKAIGVWHHAKSSLEMILNRELETNSFKDAIITCALMGTEEAAQKIANWVEKTKPTLDQIRNIEKEAVNTLWGLPDLKKIILDMLITVCSALNLNDEAKRIQQEEAARNELYQVSLTNLQTILAMGIGLKALHSGRTTQGAVEALVALMILYPAFRRGENWVGLSAGLLAHIKGLNSLSVLGIGFSAALAARVPAVQKAAINSLEAVEKTLIAGSHLAEKGFTRVISPAVEGTFHLVEKSIVYGANLSGRAFDKMLGLCEGISKTPQFTIDAIGAAVKKVDEALDRVAGSNKTGTKIQ